MLKLALFAARTGYEKFSFAWLAGQFQIRLCRRPTRGRQSPRPLDPGLRPASPPLRGSFATSGFLTDQRDAPSMARTRLFATSLSLVLKSLIRSAVLTASPPPRCYLFFLYWVRCRCEFGIASDFRLSKQNGIQLARCYFCFYVECFFAVVFLGLPLTFGSAHRMAFNPTRCYLVFR